MNTELNQAYIRYAPGKTNLTYGRQRIILDNSRFVGNVGWRQNEQTFDAASFKQAIDDKLDFYYAYVWDVNRIFGDQGAQTDFDSDSHFVNLTYKGLDFGQITAFAYLLEFDNSAANSSDTYGVKFSGKHALEMANAIEYQATWATQSDNKSNPTDYTADYLHLEAKLNLEGFFTGLGYELQASDDGVAAFRTPLGTNHAFNGWADQFLTTPATGLDDLYVFAGGKLPDNIKVAVFYHWFDSDKGGMDLGEELDIVASKPINKNQSVLLKYAHFDGKSGDGDVNKVWLQWEMKF